MAPLLERDIYLFDLDNTLYQPKEQLIEQIVVRMRDAVAKRMDITSEDALELCEGYYHQYGGTLRGLQLHHPELDLDEIKFEAHNVDLTHVGQDPALQQALQDNGKTRFVFTNSPRIYAERVLKHLGLSDSFDGVFSVEQTGLRMKPDPHAFDTICNHFGFNANNAVMFDDQPSNLMTAHNMGMRTVLVNNELEAAKRDGYATAHLPGFISELNRSDLFSPLQ